MKKTKLALESWHPTAMRRRSVVANVGEGYPVPGILGVLGLYIQSFCDAQGVSIRSFTTRVGIAPPRMCKILEGKVVVSRTHLGLIHDYMRSRAGDDFDQRDWRKMVAVITGKEEHPVGKLVRSLLAPTEADMRKLASYMMITTGYLHRICAGSEALNYSNSVKIRRYAKSIGVDSAELTEVLQVNTSQLSASSMEDRFKALSSDQQATIVKIMACMEVDNDAPVHKRT